MIAVIIVIILAFKRTLGYCVFALLPCFGSGLHNPHPSHGLGSKILVLSKEHSRCPKHPNTVILFALALPALQILNIMYFKGFQWASVKNQKYSPANVSVMFGA